MNTDFKNHLECQGSPECNKITVLQVCETISLKGMQKMGGMLT